MAQRDDLLAGRPPNTFAAMEGTLAVEDGLQLYLEAKDAANAHKRNWNKRFTSIKRLCRMLVAEFGSNRPIASLKPADWTRLMVRARKSFRSPNTLKLCVIEVRTIFNWLAENDYIERVPKFGTGFKSPTADEIAEFTERQRRTHGQRHYSADEIRKQLQLADSPLQKSWVLLGINMGCGAVDMSMLRSYEIDLENGWWRNRRVKTKAPREGKLWRRTVEQLRAYQGHERPDPHSAADEEWFFLNEEGRQFKSSQVRERIRNLIENCGHRRHGVVTYGWRRSFETFASESVDQTAIDLVMGHKDKSMAATYRQSFPEARLVAVAETVEHAVFGEVS